MAKILFFLPAFWLFCSCAWAQNQTYNPYSAFGIGEIQRNSTARNFGMGGVGVGVSDPFAINNANPASYSDLWVTTVDILGYYQRSRLTSGAVSNSYNTGGLQGISLVYKKTKLKAPHISRLAFSMNLQPFSSMGYDFEEKHYTFETNGDTLNYATRRSGNGGLNEVNFGASYRILKRKALNVGLQGNYLFGNLETTWTTQTQDGPALSYINKSNLNGMGLRLGLMYTDSIKVSAYKDSLNLQKRLQKHSQDSSALREKQKPILDKLAEIKAAPPKNPELIKEEYAKYRIDSTALQAKREAMKSDPKKFKDTYAKLRDDSLKLYKKLVKKIADKDSLQLAKKLKKLRTDSSFVEFDKKRTKNYRTSTPLEWRVGAVADYRFPLKNQQTNTIAYQEVTGQFYYIDTLNYIDNGSTQAFPPKLSAGVSLYKHLKYTLAADFTYQNWADFRLLNNDPGLSSSFKAAIGGEWTPDYRDIRNIFKRMSYRAGVSFEKTYLSIRGQDIYRYSMSVGVGIPVARFLPSPNPRDFEKMYAFNTSRINLGFELLNGGQSSGGLVSEFNYRVTLGVSFNEIWFSTKKYQ